MTRSIAHNGPRRGARGQSNGAARLTEQQVREIRAHCKLYINTREFAARFGVNVSSIRDILNRVTWSWLND